LDLLINLIVLFTLLTGILAIYCLRFASEIERVYLWYLGVNGIFEIISNLIVKLGYTNNLPILHAYTLVQFVFLTPFFAMCFRKLGINVKYMWFLFLGSAGIIVNSIFIQSIYIFNSITKTAVDFYIVITCMILFYLLIKDAVHDRQAMKPSASFISAAFMAASVSFIFFMFSNTMLEMENSDIVVIYDIRAAVYLVVIFISLIGLWQLYSREKIIRRLQYE